MLLFSMISLVKATSTFRWELVSPKTIIKMIATLYVKCTEMDYGMSGGTLRLRQRGATAGYVLRKWNVDCSPDHRLA